MANALKDRKNREKAAVAIIDESDKKDAIKVSVDTYKSLTKSAQNSLTISRKAAWTTFESDIKQCHDLEDALLEEERVKQEAIESTATRAISAESEGTSIKDTIKAGFDTLRSLFN
jgi:ubiquitin